MGLDMYLHRRTYVKNWSHMAPEEVHQISVKLAKKKHPYIETKKISGIVEEVGYWRKVNAIHNWFVQNCQDGVDDCKEYSVESSQLEELLNICKQIKEDHSKAEELLPPQEGFFFGNTDLDDWYFRGINDTIEILEPLVKMNTKLNEDAANKIFHKDYPYYYYQSSW